MVDPLGTLTGSVRSVPPWEPTRRSTPVEGPTAALAGEAVDPITTATSGPGGTAMSPPTDVELAAAQARSIGPAGSAPALTTIALATTGEVESTTTVYAPPGSLRAGRSHRRDRAR